MSERDPHCCSTSDDSCNDDFCEYVACEWCNSLGCQSCGWTGHQLDPDSGEPIVQEEHR